MVGSRRHPRSITLLMAAGSGLLAMATFAGGREAPDAGASAAPRLAQVLDLIIQPRFQDDRAGVFGTGRVVMPDEVHGHGEVARFTPKNKAEASLFREVEQGGHDYVVGFLHCAHVPGKGRNLDGSPTFPPPGAKPASVARVLPIRPYVQVLVARHPIPVSDPSVRDKPARPQPVIDADVLDPQRLAWDLQKAAIAVLPRLQKSQSVDVTVDETWQVSMRPVVASKASCLGCHSGARSGETLGVMVYAIKKPAYLALTRP